MKKLFLAFGLTLMAACSLVNDNNVTSDVDSVVLDSTEVVLESDTLDIDSIN